MWHDLMFWRIATIASAGIGQTMFLLLYMTWPWWRNFLGRALFFKTCAFAALIDVAIVGQFMDWPHEDATFIALYGALSVGIWAQFFAFLRVRVQGREQTVSGNRNVGHLFPRLRKRLTRKKATT